MNTYIYILRLIPRLYNDNAWSNSDDEIVNKHFNRLKTDYEKHIVIHAGRTDDTMDNRFGIVIFWANDINEATLYMLDDPAIQNQIMTGEVYLYRMAIY